MATRKNNAYRRLTGRIRLNGRSALLETNEGNLIYLESPDDLAAFEDLQVVAEGQMSVADRMSLTWIDVAGG